MLLLLFAALAHASEGRFDHVRDAEGCSIAMRPESDPEGAAMRADCVWPEVRFAHIEAMLDAYERYSEWVFPVAVAEVRRREAERALVYQRQEIFGLADREVLLWMKRDTRADGMRVSWTTADGEPLTLQPGAIRTPRNIGYWDVTARPDGGVAVIHEVALDAGGSVPRWIVNLVRTRAFAKVMADVRAAAAAGVAGPGGGGGTASQPAGAPAAGR